MTSSSSKIPDAAVSADDETLVDSHPHSPTGSPEKQDSTVPVTVGTSSEDFRRHGFYLEPDKRPDKAVMDTVDQICDSLFDRGRDNDFILERLQVVGQEKDRCTSVERTRADNMRDKTQGPRVLCTTSPERQRLEAAHFRAKQLIDEILTTLQKRSTYFPGSKTPPEPPEVVKHVRWLAFQILDTHMPALSRPENCPCCGKWPWSLDEDEWKLLRRDLEYMIEMFCYTSLRKGPGPEFLWEGLRSRMLRNLKHKEMEKDGGEKGEKPAVQERGRRVNYKR